MANSKYPQQLDTSIEIPPIRDNVTEIGSEVINSLRSAIFNIEKTLGLNPQGAAGNTVSERLNRFSDSSGNIKPEALSLANILSGPIIDNDVSKVAAIQESKLKLDYPTTLLQDEISILNSQIDLIQNILTEVSNELAVHLSAYALSSHTASSISVSEKSVLASNIATLSLGSANLQSTLEEIYNSHINYTGVNISSLNNSHRSDQVYFDNTNTSNIIFSDSVQGAIEDLAGIESVGFRNALLNITSNGRIRNGSTFDAYEGQNTGSILIDTVGATYVRDQGTSITTFTFNSPQSKLETISKFDILTLTGSSIDSDNTTYQISKVIENGDGLVEQVVVFGGPKGASSSGLFIQITGNQYVSYNPAGFSCIARPRSTKTNTPDIQYLNPDCATIISQNIIPATITTTNHKFNLTVDDKTEITIETYNSSVSEQSIDSIVQKINDQCVDQHLNITAFKVKSNNCFELALVHNLPGIDGDIINRTIKITNGSSNDGLTELGLLSFKDIVFEGSTGHSVSLNGLILSQFGLIKAYTGATIELVSGTYNLSLPTGDFNSTGIRIGDLAVITGSTDSGDDGSYRIGSLNDGIATLDLSVGSFNGSLSSDSRVYIIRSSANIDELTFEEAISADGSIIFDIFMDENKDVFHSKRLEIDGVIKSTNFYGVVSDVSNNFILTGDTASLSIDTSGFATLTDPSLQTGASVFVGTSGTYNIFSSDGLSFITLDVSATALPLSTQSVTIYGFDEINQNNFTLCRGSFSTSLGRILGESNSPGIPALIDKRKSGTTDHSVIGDTFIEKYIEGPRNELRSGGVIRGMAVSDATYTSGSEIYQNFSVSAGIIIVNGIRREFSGLLNLRVDTDQTYIVVMDEEGCIQAVPYIDNPLDPGNDVSPFFEKNVVYLAEVTNNGTTATVYDLRLFIDHIDYKILNEIKVSNDERFGHFQDIALAVAYSKRFKKMFPDLNTPTILIDSGNYSINDTILIDFDINIKGSGSSTLLTKTDSFATGTSLTGSKVDLSTAIFMIGGGPNSNADDIVFGVELSDFTYSTSSSLTHVGCVIALTQPLVKSSVIISRRATYRFENINFQGPSSMDGSAADPDKIGEYALVIGQQNPSTLNAIGSLVMGNVIFTNCRLNRMGLESGSIRFTESSSSTIKDIIVSNNIVTFGSPNLSSTSSVVIEYPITPTMDNVIEVGNTFRIGS